MHSRNPPNHRLHVLDALFQNLPVFGSEPLPLDVVPLHSPDIALGEDCAADDRQLSVGQCVVELGLEGAEGQSDEGSDLELLNGGQFVVVGEVGQQGREVLGGGGEGFLGVGLVAADVVADFLDCLGGFLADQFKDALLAALFGFLLLLQAETHSQILGLFQLLPRFFLLLELPLLQFDGPHHLLELCLVAEGYSHLRFAYLRQEDRIVSLLLYLISRLLWLSLPITFPLVLSSDFCLP